MNQDILSLEPSVPDQDRRQFLVTKLTAGFALAVMPVSAQTITTDTNGLEAGEVSIPVPDGKIPGYRVMPSKGTKFPAVLVVQEIFGVHEHIKDICRRFAKLGYLAVAPELYARQGDVSKIPDVKDVIAKVVSKVPDSQVISDLDATMAWAGKSNGDLSRAAITGFCWGGRITWLYAAHNPKLKAGGAWYGRLVGEPTAMTPKNPVDIAASLKVPVLGLYGGQDQGIPADTIEKMRAALKNSSSGSEIVVYPDAPHGFNADYRPSYRKADAEDAWKKLLAWFKRHGAA